MGLAPVVVTPLFLYGPLAEIHFLQGIFPGFDAPEARAEGWQITCEDTPLPLAGLIPGAESVKGYLVDHPETMADLIFVLSALGLGPAKPLSVECRGETFAAQVFPGQPGPLVWDATALRGRGALILQDAIMEILNLKGRVAPGDFAHRRAMILSRAGARVAAAQPAPVAVRSATHADQVTQEANEITHAGFFVSRKYTLRHPRFDGTQSDRLEREVFVATDASLVLPYDPVRDRVLLVEQFRMGPFGRGDPHPWMLEPVAGRIDGGESPEEAAHRECLEEAGLTLRGLEEISRHYCTPGYSTEFFHLFLGICDLPDLEQGRGGLATEHEDIRTHVIDFPQAMALVQSGEANNGPLILCLLWLERERARLRASA
ncbi:NUDIX domain-containing protein [Roseovarius sp.]|uniref:NUDIX domain-containing protein n=1 Tax=Roseovarius sp. TaxID=1486281 RepID=UPI002637FFFA|nr:NUDIX domain-containing protein [Roseovarius sp.]